MNKRSLAVRIIGGAWRGRLLPVLDREGLRPSKDMVRETVFNWLQPRLVGKRCLDCFAGTGALGFEAGSRGASKVVLLEKDHGVASHLMTIAGQLESEKRLEIQSVSALDYLQTALSFDVIFLDPPFQANLWQSCLEAIVKSRILAESGVIYIESSKQQGLPDLPAELCYIKEKRSGQVVYALAEWAS